MKDKKVEIYSVSSPENFQEYENTGNEDFLNDINIENLKSGDKIVIAREGGAITIEIR